MTIFILWFIELISDSPIKKSPFLPAGSILPSCRQTGLIWFHSLYLLVRKVSHWRNPELFWSQGILCINACAPFTKFAFSYGMELTCLHEISSTIWIFEDYLFPCQSMSNRIISSRDFHCLSFKILTHFVQLFLFLKRFWKLTDCFNSIYTV